eukprot:1154640-Pelagomonas_calceolata.AAC.6
MIVRSGGLRGTQQKQLMPNMFAAREGIIECLVAWQLVLYICVVLAVSEADSAIARAKAPQPAWLLCTCASHKHMSGNELRCGLKGLRISPLARSRGDGPKILLLG